MGRPTSQVRTLLPCPLCGSSMSPAAVESTLTFYCGRGHEMAVGDLLRAQSSSVKGGLELLLAEWERQHQALLTTAEDARQHGFIDVAEIFNRHAKSLQSRIGKMRDTFSTSDSSKLIALPKAFRSSESSCC